MSKLPVLKPKEVLRVLLRAGFYVYHQKGSHAQLRHAVRMHLRVTIPIHSNFDLPLPVLHSILKQAEISREEFIALI